MRGIALEAMIRASIREAMQAGRPGAWAAPAAGLAVAAPVAEVFLHFSGEPATSAALAMLLGGIAFACTSAGAVMATRAPSGGRAVAWVLASNIIPPTLVCLPGFFISLPSGVLAAILVLPMVLAVRAWAREERLGRPERELLFGAAILTLSAIGLLLWLGYERVEPDPYPPRGAALGWVPALLTSLAALALAVRALGRDARRLWLAARIRGGEARAFRVAGAERGGVRIEQVAGVGAGPMRSASTTETLGELPRSIARTVGAAVLASLGLLAAAAVAAVTLAP